MSSAAVKDCALLNMGTSATFLGGAKLCARLNCMPFPTGAIPNPSWATFSAVWCLRGRLLLGRRTLLLLGDQQRILRSLLSLDLDDSSRKLLGRLNHCFRPLSLIQLFESHALCFFRRDPSRLCFCDSPLRKLLGKEDPVSEVVPLREKDRVVGSQKNRPVAVGSIWKPTTTGSVLLSVPCPWKNLVSPVGPTRTLGPNEQAIVVAPGDRDRREGAPNFSIGASWRIIRSR
jgi:hypothetical protein